MAPAWVRGVPCGCPISAMPAAHHYKTQCFCLQLTLHLLGIVRHFILQECLYFTTLNEHCCQSRHLSCVYAKFSIFVLSGDKLLLSSLC